MQCIWHKCTSIRHSNNVYILYKLDTEEFLRRSIREKQDFWNKTRMNHHSESDTEESTAPQDRRNDCCTRQGYMNAVLDNLIKWRVHLHKIEKNKDLRRNGMLYNITT